MEEPLLNVVPGDVGGPAFDVLALVASAGGLEAIGRVLRDLPKELPVAIVVGQHLGSQGSALSEILQRQTGHPTRRIENGDRLEPGRVFVAPPRKKVELLPDRTFAVHPNERGALEKPLDFLLESLADSLGARVLAVVLTGMGNDAATGALALRNAGGAVIAQSEDTAEQPSMPRSAIGNGAATLVLPLHEIGGTLGQVLAGGRFPTPRNEIEAIDALFEGPGEARATLRGVDWTANPLGPVVNWSPGRRTIVRAALGTEFPMVVFLGPEYVQIGNDAFAPSLGEKALQGLPARVTWGEIWDFVGPQFEQIERTGKPIYAEDALFEPNRRGFVEEAYFTYCYSPLYDEGKFAGILSTQLETTERVLAERRLATLSALDVDATGKPVGEACDQAVGTLAENPRDVPFALMYLVDGDARADLCACVGVDPGHAAAPRSIPLQGGHPAWPLGKALIEGKPVFVDDLRTRFHGFRAGPWPEPPRSAFLVPLRTPAEDGPLGVLVLGVSSRLSFDSKYREFFELVGARIAATLTDAQARHKERERTQKLAALNEAKTEFFSNVSHEFRTPLTLMLGPLEELTHRRDELPSPLSDEVETAARNARRLLNLVNTLLDFSQIEEGKVRPRRRLTDLAALTADVASLFRSAAERAGLRFVVDCPPLSEPVSVDPVMWEKVVSNLLSNALKFTFEGEIEVGIRELTHHVELTVRDTGEGIPEDEIPNLFRRFHRIRGTRARTHEGSGIGLALVQDLVRLHFGRVRVRSREGEGTTFTIWIPRGGRTFDEAITSPEHERSTAAALAEVASHWEVSELGTPDGVLDQALSLPLPIHGTGAKILVVDDNADMRTYLRRLLLPHWHVETAADGAEALGRLRDDGYELVLADVMMPNLDGFELLRRIRSDERHRTLPVVLLTARAGEESAIEGLLAGADDYLVKPFASRELVARVGAQLELARVRRRAQEINAFLVRFSDAVRDFGDPHRVLQTACRMVATHLGADRSHWAEVDWESEEFVVEGARAAEGSPAIVSRSPLDAWGPYTQAYLRGDSVIVGNVPDDKGISESAKETLARSGIAAFVGVPVMAGGRLAGVLTVTDRSPRRWTDDEVALVGAVAGRCWPEIERARAEEALRQSEARQAFLLELSDVLRTLDSAAAIQGEATRLLREHFAAGWCYYVEWDERGAFGEVLQDATSEGLRSLAGRHDVSDVPDFLDFLHSGQAFAVSDFARYELMSPRIRARYGALGFRSMVGAPIVNNGRLITTLLVGDTAPREWSDDDLTLVREVADRTWTALARARAAEALRTTAERQAFLLTLSDALRPLDSAAEIQGEAARLLREHLAVGWCYYVGWDEAAARGIVLRDSTRDGLPSLVGTHDVSDVPGFLDLLRKGSVLNVRDYENFDELSPELRARYTALGFRSMLVATLVKQGRLVASLIVGDTAARDWSSDAEALLMEVAERTWAAVERARAEEALRTSEEKYRSLFETMNEGFALCELVRDETGRPVDYRYLDLNPAVVRHVGITPETLLGRRATDVFQNLDPWLVETYARVVDGGEAVLTERYFPHVDRWLRLNVFPRGGDRFAALYGDVTERKRAEIALQENAERQAFLLRLSDALRPLVEPAAIQGAATRLLGETLGVNRAYYAEIDEARGIWRIEREYALGVSASLCGVHRIDDFGWAVSPLRRGETLVIEDAPASPLVPEPDRAAVAAIQVGAKIDVPLVKNDALVGALTVTQNERRRWRPAEIALVHDTAERIWAAVERARAEAALRVSEARYRTMFESIDEGFAVAEVLYDAEGRPVDLLYLEANPAASRLTGGTVFAGRRASEVLPEGDRTSLQIYDTVARTGQPARVERHYASFDRWYEGHISPVNDVERDGTNTVPRRVAIVFRDVTERLRTFEALRENEAKYRALFDALDEGFALFDMIYDANGEPVDLRYVETNPAFERLAGRRPQPGQTMRELFPEAEETWLQDYAEVARSGQAKRFVERIPGLDRLFEVDVFPAGGQNRLAALFRDVTEGKGPRWHHPTDGL